MNSTAPDVAVPERVRPHTELYGEVLDFLYDEARLLDEVRLTQWTQLLAEDLVYRVPLRETRSLAEQGATIVRSVQHYYDNYRSILGRAMRLTHTKSAWAEDPPSRTRRLVTNVLVETTAKHDEYAVRSYLLLTRSRFNQPDLDVLSAERHDLLRRGSTGFKLARREVIVDQAVLGMQNLAIFL